MTESSDSALHLAARRRPGVIFDLDGTLADTLADIAAALNQALTQVGLPPAAADQVRAWVGDGLPALCRRAAPTLDDAQHAKLVHAALAAYRSGYLVHTVLYPGIRDLLAVLHARRIRLAVLSNKPHELTRLTVEGLGIAECFDAVCGYTSEQEKKPSPVPALRIARRWNLSPDRIYFVGDGPADMHTAAAAGMIAIGVTWGFRPREELRAAGARHLVDHPLEIADLPGILSD